MALTIIFKESNDLYKEDLFNLNIIRRIRVDFWIRSGRNGRNKRVAPGFLFFILTICILLVAVVLFLLGYYTPWILHRGIDKEQNKIIKLWAPDLSMLRNSFPQVVQDQFAAIINVLSAQEPSDNETIPTIKINIENNGLDWLNKEIFRFGMGLREKKPGIKGFFKAPDGSPLPVKVSLRGVMPGHHMIWKPSLRLKFNKNKFPDGFRNHILIAPEDATGLRNWLSNELSKKWNLLDIGDHAVRLFINGNYMGLYNRIWRFDESIFIQSGRIPGYIFKLEHLDKREFMRVWKDWKELDAWKVFGDDPEYGKSLFRSVIKETKQIIYWNIKHGREELSRRVLQMDEFIDQEAFAKYLAISAHAGETHIDNKHNNSFWLDPISGKLIPILEDVVGYDFPEMKNQLYRPISKNQGAFVSVWLQNPYNLERYIYFLNKMLNSFGSENAMKKLVRHQWETIKPSAMADLYTSEIGWAKKLIPITSLQKNVNGLLVFINERNQWLKKQLRTVKLSIVRKTSKSFDLFLEGPAGIHLERKDGKSFSLIGTARKQKTIKLLPSKNTVLTSQLRSLYSPPDFYAFYQLPGSPDDYNYIHALTHKEVSFSSKPSENRPTAP